MQGHKEVAELLLAKGADVKAIDNAGNTPLHIAPTEELVQLLLEYKADLQIKNNDGLTPFESLRVHSPKLAS